MPYDNVKASPTYLPFQSDITFQVTASTATNVYVLTRGLGSAFGAISGYVLNNDASNGNAIFYIRAGGNTMTSITVAPGQYRTIFVVGADEIAVRATGVASPAVTGEIHTVINANPM